MLQKDNSKPCKKRTRGSSSYHRGLDCGGRNDAASFRNEMYLKFQPWAMRTYGDSAKTKTVTRKKQSKIFRVLRGEETRTAENSKFCAWVKQKGFCIRPLPGYDGSGENGLMYVPSYPAKDQDGSEKPVYKRVAIVEDFFDIIFNLHVETEGKNGKHAGQKRTYRAISEKYSFLPREAVTKFLLQCSDCQKRGLSNSDSIKSSRRSVCNRKFEPTEFDLNLPITTVYLRHMRSLGFNDADIFDPQETEAKLAAGKEIDAASEDAANSIGWGNFSYGLKKCSIVKDSSAKSPCSVPHSQGDVPSEDASSNGAKDDDDDDDDDSDDKIDAQHYDPERLKAFNMFVRLFVDENLDRIVPISKQPKEKIQAIIDSCNRQFPEFAERARKRIRTYLKSCRRNKRTREQNGLELSRPTPPHLTSIQAEQILAHACDNESENAKRMRMGLEPLAQPFPALPSGVRWTCEQPGEGARSPSFPQHPVGVERFPSDKDSRILSPPVVAPSVKVEGAPTLNGHPASFPTMKPSFTTTTTTTATGAYQRESATGAILTKNSGSKQSSPGLPLPPGGGDLAPDSSETSSSSRRVCKTNLSAGEVAAVRQLITGYRESAAFLLRSAEELEQLLSSQR